MSHTHRYDMVYDVVMEYFGWDSLWHPNPGQWYVGIWTGPDRDLLCVKHCETAEEAEQCLSPQGECYEDAFTLAMMKIREVEQ
jgi:hypothetical protein